MNYYEALAKQAQPVELAEQETSYFEAAAKNLDPRLFQDAVLNSHVRSIILSMVLNHLNANYREADSWAQVYLVGSGVSFSWQAHREPADLDCLISINYIQFRQSNLDYRGWSDSEIAAGINQGFKAELTPTTKEFMGVYELTFYVNENPNIADLKPYSAYSVTDNRWLVEPSEMHAPENPEWDKAVERDKTSAIQIIERYSTAWSLIKKALNPAHRLNAEAALKLAVEQGSALYRDIHESRSLAFSPDGQGYSDFHNYRWQAGKRSGVVPAMKKLHGMLDEASGNFATETYGVELPDTATLLRRAYQSNR